MHADMPKGCSEIGLELVREGLQQLRAGFNRMIANRSSLYHEQLESQTSDEKVIELYGARRRSRKVCYKPNLSVHKSLDIS
jgi:hypothetical protein